MLGLVLISTSAFTRSNDLAHRPRSFSTPKGKAVFADFTTANYAVTYDATLKQAKVRADITLNMVEAGNLVFDSVQAPTLIQIDGKETTATETKTPSSETTVRVLDEHISTGTHRLVVEVPLKELVEFTSQGVKSAFWTSDLSERKFLERYMPANLEYDQVKMTIKVEFIGSQATQVIYTNGTIAKKLRNSFEITYPAYYTASSVYFHTVPQGSTEESRFSLKSIDGRNLPVVVYISKGIMSGGMKALDNLKLKTTQIIQELESDYGPFPHSQIIVYNAGSGGMEYCGATITEMRALGHELFHSYFARGVMPANGNSGWLDEALASWRDEGYLKSATMMGTSRMSAHPYYTRTTDRAAYSFGERFMRYLDHKLSEKGGLKPFMRHMVERRAKAPLFVEEFIQEMSQFYGVSVKEDFVQYTYGSKDSSFKSSSKEHHHPMHQKMTLEQLKQVL